MSDIRENGTLRREDFPSLNRVRFNKLELEDKTQVIPVIVVDPSGEFTRVTFMDSIAYDQTRRSGQLIPYTEELKPSVGESIFNPKLDCDQDTLIVTSKDPSILRRPIDAKDRTETMRSELAGLEFNLKPTCIDNQVGGPNLATAIVLDEKSRKPLMVGFADQDAVAATVVTGNATFWSRSQQGLWVKGSTSGDFIDVTGISRVSRNAIAYVGTARTGRVCHTGAPTCFK